jgi:hypothetical protein
MPNSEQHNPLIEHASADENWGPDRAEQHPKYSYEDFHKEVKAKKQLMFRDVEALIDSSSDEEEKRSLQKYLANLQSKDDIQWQLGELNNIHTTISAALLSANREHLRNRAAQFHKPNPDEWADKFSADLNVALDGLDLRGEWNKYVTAGRETELPDNKGFYRPGSRSREVEWEARRNVCDTLAKIYVAMRNKGYSYLELCQ